MPAPLITIGSSIPTVIDILGAPEREEVNSDEVLYYYCEPQLRLMFPEEDNFCLGLITCEDPKVSCLQRFPIGNTLKFLLAKFPTARLEDDFETALDYFADDLGLSFWVVDAIVTRIGVFPKYIDDTPLRHLLMIE